MLKVAIDESGTHKDAPVLAIAACMASSTQWGHFTREWEPVARKYPKGYHATSAKPEDNAFLADILRRRLEPIGSLAVTIAYEDFKAVVPHEVKSQFGAEYWTGVLLIVRSLGLWCSQTKKGWLAYVLESGHPGGDSVFKVLEGLKRHPEYHLFSHTWVGKDVLVTHAADLVAHEVATCYGGPPSEILASLQRNVLLDHFSRDELVEGAAAGMEWLRARKWEKTKAKVERKRHRL